MRKKIFKYSLIVILGLIGFIVTTALGDNISKKEGDELLYIENREPIDAYYSDSTFMQLVDSAANYIVDSAGMLKPIMEKLLAIRSGQDSVVSILHVGDSHIQAGFFSGRVRELMQAQFGDAGRGLITPYKLAGGNEPTDYSITTPHKFTTSNARTKDNGGHESLTGGVLTFSGAEAEFKIWVKNGFDAITLLHSPKAPIITDTSRLMFTSYCGAENTTTSTRLVLSEYRDSLHLSGVISEKYNDPTYYGFVLESGRPGVIYHGLGANGAAFEHIESNTTITEGGADVLNPDLIIISLGTNNCFGGNYRSNQFRIVADRFVKKMVKHYPNSAIVITTPMESCRRSGGRRIPNENVADVARVLKEVAADYGVASWDMYAAAGGKGANAKWYGKRLFSSDRIHLTQRGYGLQGEMLYEAFSRYYNNYIEYGSGEPRVVEERADSLSVEGVEELIVEP